MDLLHFYEQGRSPEEAALRQTLAPMLDGLSRALGFPRALVALYDPENDCLRGSIGLNVPDAIAESLEVSLRDRAHPLVMALLLATPVRVADVATELHIDEHDKGLLLELGITSFVAVPLRNGPQTSAGDPDEAVGTGLPATGVVILSKEGPIREEEIAWLTPFANQAGATLASARDVELLRGSSERSAIENEWLWAMIDSVADPVVVTDQQNDIIRQNRRAELIFRSGPDDSEGKRNAIRMNNFLFTATLSTLTLESGASSRELTLVDPIEGTDMVFEVISHHTFHYRLNRVGTVSVLKNITDLRHVTEELSENAQRLQSADEKVRIERDRLDLVLRNVPNPIIVTDEADQIIQMNQEAVRVFRTRPGGAPESRHEQVTASNSAKLASFLAQLRLETAPVRSGELTLIDPDTEEAPVMGVTSTEIRDDQGAFVGVVSVMQNLTRLREIEQQRVRQQLFESEKLAATGRLAASIAHEINNPLEAIKNSLYLLVHRTPADDPSHQFLEIAMKETDRVSRILREMLGFYRPAVNMLPTDINTLVIETERLVEKELRRTGVWLQNDLCRDLPMIKGSADQLKQVLLNLLLNAQDALPDGGTVHVSTQLAKPSDPGFLLPQSVLIRIRDSGHGIADEHLPSIFEPFFSTKQAKKGTGLGLWVSQDIVQRHGGTIMARSQVGHGTTFTIALPTDGPPINE